MLFKKQKTLLKDNYSPELLYSLGLIIICIAFSIGIIPTGFYTDDFNYMEEVQKHGSLFKNSFDTTPLAGSYYRPILTLIWGVCYHIFGLWNTGYHIVLFLIYLGMLLFFQKTVSHLTNSTIAFIASILLLLHTAAALLTWLSWITTITSLFFLWFTIYFIVKNNLSNRNYYLIFIVLGTVCSIFSKETTFIPLIIILSYYALFEKPEKKHHTYVYGLLVAFILLIMRFGPSGVFRNTGSQNTIHILNNLHHHLYSILYSGFPILLIPLLFAIIIFIQDRNIFRSLAFFLPSSIILILFPYMYIENHANLYFFVLPILILILLFRKYLLEFLLKIMNKKALIWYFLFLGTFAPILPFYLSSSPYHYLSFSFFLTAFAVTYFIFTKNVRLTSFYDDTGNKNKSRSMSYMEITCAVLIISGLALNSFTVLYRSLEHREAISNSHVKKTRKEYHKARSNLLANVAKYILKNSESNSMEISAKDISKLSYNSRFLFIYLRHFSNDFKVIYNPDAEIREYSSDFIMNLAMLELDSRISFDPETEKYIMEQVGDNLLINNGFEHERDESFKYSDQSYSDDYSMLLMKEDYPHKENIPFPNFGTLTLEPGLYIFGGYYKSANLREKAYFMVVDSRGYDAGNWHSNTISGTKNWVLLNGQLYLEETSSVNIKPLVINNFTSGDVYIDDLFLMKLKNSDYM